MKIFLLRRIGDADWDEYLTKLVRAKNEKQAREMANERVGDEGRIWTNPNKVSCETLSRKGDPEIIIEQFNTG